MEAEETRLNYHSKKWPSRGESIDTCHGAWSVLKT